MPEGMRSQLRRSTLVFALAAVTAAATFSTPRSAEAFCGFYVAPNDAPLYADASMVALMRDGTRTVLSMSNNYKGPATDFAMVVPVPVVLQKENVKTLPLDIFHKLEALSAPRLVEYWEQDPCMVDMAEDEMTMKKSGLAAPGASASGKADTHGVKIEAQFTVGEYDVVVLSAEQSDGLETWLHENKYNIPKGASSALAPYIKEQQKFFVAKVDIKKVRLDERGVAVLSPLRFSYESPDFRLPVRLGLLNSAGKQDLVIFVLAKDKRYEVANYENTFVPTNIDVSDSTRDAFAPFYATLFDATIAKAGGRAVVTEYAWASGSCDPCPTPPLEDSDIATLGGDVLFKMTSSGAAGVPGDPLSGYYGGASVQVVLTRLHTRYDAATLSEDLVFRAADPVVGGREFLMSEGTPGAMPALEKGARKDSYNNFQARYAIRHPWTGKIACDKPRRGIWGGPPDSAAPPIKPATGLAAAKRGDVTLVEHVVNGLDDVASWDRAAGLSPKAPGQIALPPTQPKAQTAQGPLLPDAPSVRKSCNCSLEARDDAPSLLSWFSFCALGVILVARRRGRWTFGARP